ncbi:MAG TPA: hypothetical protein VK186_17735, partial [Candidatus Deferrimicrobium sp.]|nr:hypothetical protein [Candidatus Deferrimicrobium sp.]
MKPSNYNIFVHYEPDNAYIVYNAVSNGFYVFNEQQFTKVKDILDNAGKAGNGCPSPLQDTLIKGRFLIDDDMDELKILKLRNNISRFNTE